MDNLWRSGQFSPRGLPLGIPLSTVSGELYKVFHRFSTGYLIQTKVLTAQDLLCSNVVPMLFINTLYYYEIWI